MFSIFWPFHFARAIVQFLLNLAVITTCLFTLTGFLGDKHWALDLTSHFRVQYLVIQSAVLVLSMIALRLQRKSRFEVLGTLVFLAFFIGLNLTQIVPYFMSQDARKFDGAMGRVKILHMNVLIFNRNYADVADVIRKSDAEILSIQEYTPVWLEHLTAAGVLKKFPYRAVHLDSGNALYSKRPFKKLHIQPIREESFIQYFGIKSGGVILADITLGGKTVTLVNLHPPVPAGPFLVDSYRNYLQFFESNKARFRNSILLFGDLNTTPWSTLHKRYLTTLNLKDARLGHGLVPTWPSMMPVFFIPIDHILVSDDIRATKLETGPYTGSDHLPLYAELEIAP